MRVLQLNIWARSGPYRDRAPRLRQLFADLAPDLIAMQEVDIGDGGGNQAEDLLDGLGYAVAYERREGAYRGDPGVAVASRQPILDRALKDLSHGGPALAARIGVGDDAFWFCSAVPMSWMPGYEGQREDECLARMRTEPLRRTTTECLPTSSSWRSSRQRRRPGDLGRDQGRVMATVGGMEWSASV